MKLLLIAVSFVGFAITSHAVDSPAGAGTASAAIPATATLRVGAVAPDFISNDFSGSIVKLSDYKGKIVVLDFWATWCSPCQRSMPHTQSVASEYKDNNVVVLAVCTSDGRAAYDKWMPTHQATYPDMTFTFDPAATGEDRVAKALYGVEGIPAQFVIGTDGIVAAVIIGYFPDEVRLEAALRKMGVPLHAAALAKVQAAEKQTTEKATETLEAARTAGAAEAKKPMHEQYGALKAGNPVPQFSVTGLDGKAISLSDLRGKTILLGLWTAANATGVQVCTAAMPHLSDLAKRYKDQGVVVLNVCLLTPKTNFDAWAASNKEAYGFIAAYDPAGSPAKGSAVKSMYTSLGNGYAGYLRMPAEFVINPKGEFVGYVYNSENANAGIAALLRLSGVRLVPEDVPTLSALAGN